MTLLYEQIFTPFLNLSYEEQQKLIEKIRKRRVSDTTPKKQQKKAKAKTSEKQSQTEKWRRTLDELSPQEMEELIQEFEDASKNKSDQD
jgi:hypothetical protein